MSIMSMPTMPVSMPIAVYEDVQAQFYCGDVIRVFTLDFARLAYPCMQQMEHQFFEYNDEVCNVEDYFFVPFDVDDGGVSLMVVNKKDKEDALCLWERYALSRM